MSMRCRFVCCSLLLSVWLCTGPRAGAEAPHHRAGGEAFSEPVLLAQVQAESLIPGNVPETTAPEEVEAEPQFDPGDPFVDIIEDPLEPMNRSFHGFNELVIVWVLRPLERGYQFILPKVARKKVKNAGENLAWPVRLVNNLLQAKWHGAWQETERFGINTTVGLLGFFDPAGGWGIPAHEEDFGQTFGTWGWEPETYLTLPFVGPSNSRDAVGYVFDAAFDPRTYIPGAKPFFGFNRLSLEIDQYLLMILRQFDPYVLSRDLWTLTRKRAVLDFQPDSSVNGALPTLQAIFLQPQDEDFYKRAKNREVRIPDTGEKLPYSLWLQKGPAPVMYILPGTGGHRLSQAAVALAEMAYGQGFTAVTISSTMNWEFMESAGSTSVPGFPPIDAADIHSALERVHRQLEDRYEERITGAAVMGLSLGAMHTLYLAGLEDELYEGELRFDRYLAINPPVDLLYAMNQIDGYYFAPQQWPEGERRERIVRTLLKAVALTDGGLTPGAQLPFSEIESKFLIGLNFRLQLRDVIYLSQRMNDLGILEAEFSKLDREPIYNEIERYSFQQYLYQFVIRYYQNYYETRYPTMELMQKGNLRAIGAELNQNERVRIFVNQNDFLLSDSDIEWLRGSFEDGRLVVFNEGGHLGNLYLPRVQNAIFERAEDLLVGTGAPGEREAGDEGELGEGSEDDEGE